MKQMFMHGDGESLQTAVLHDGKLVDFSMERSEKSGLVGNIYKGKVVNVLPGMQAAFVDIGLSKNAFLYVDELLHPHMDKHANRKPDIKELVRPGQELLVQVMKEPIGGKGARITTHFTLPGRYLVYMPTADYIGVSKKIGSEQERSRLRHAGEELRRNGEGIIMRTAASEAAYDVLEADVLQLREQWEKVAASAETVSAPYEIHREAGLMSRIVRDSVTEELDEVWIDDSARFETLKQLLEEMTPPLAHILHYHRPRNEETLFDVFGVTAQINAAFQSAIRLPSGGSLIWDETEALTVIDVNTGRFTGGKDLEDTVFLTNMEAADEIARLLRVRDVGGIIIIDFIDMELESNRDRVLHQLEHWTRLDRTKCTVVGWTRLGLLEMTRKKARESSVKQNVERCQACGGTGKQKQLPQ